MSKFSMNAAAVTEAICQGEGNVLKPHKELVQSVLEKANSKGRNFAVAVFLALLSFHRLFIRFEGGKYAGWRAWVPEGTLSDFWAELALLKCAIKASGLKLNNLPGRAGTKIGVDAEQFEELKRRQIDAPKFLGLLAQIRDLSASHVGALRELPDNIDLSGVTEEKFLDLLLPLFWAMYVETNGNYFLVQHDGTARKVLGGKGRGEAVRVENSSAFYGELKSGSLIIGQRLGSRNDYLSDIVVLSESPTPEDLKALIQPEGYQHFISTSPSLKMASAVSLELPPVPEVPEDLREQPRVKAALGKIIEQSTLFQSYLARLNAEDSEGDELEAKLADAKQIVADIEHSLKEAIARVNSADAELRAHREKMASETLSSEERAEIESKLIAVQENFQQALKPLETILKAFEQLSAVA